jgi:hypothetical protein
MTQKALTQQRKQEIDDRDRTRFHEARREVYADFLGAVNDAAGRLSHDAIERQRAAGHTSETAPVGELVGQFGADAPMRMTRHESIIKLISGSPDVRQASTDFVNAVLAYLDVAPNSNHDEWNRALSAKIGEQQTAYGRFVDVANGELTSAP